MKAIAYSYWRRIKDGARKFNSIPDSIKADVEAVGQQEVVDHVITQEEYNAIIGNTLNE